MNRRDFVKSVGIVSFGLFLPKWIKPSWKQKPTLIIPPYDYEVALLTPAGREVSGAGYTRLLGSWGAFRPAFSQSQRTAEIVNNQTLRFPQATGDWGEVDSIAVIPKKKSFKIAAQFASTQKVTSGDTLQFLPGHLSISMS
jgi:hypothetical protein